MTQWVIGQKVRCVADSFAPEYIYNAPDVAMWPVSGRVYTISGFNFCNVLWQWTSKAPTMARRTVNLGLRLEELSWPRGFDERAFRPEPEQARSVVG
jgi:hypothetical protein